ncbi:metallophosphoesterase family protein [Halolamina rubra]|uniref:metallophosphoesterase family protein n=1 Tax=Halolamina rubra TaxID=1380430 RepID=UPI000A80A393|nr:metallophosphoesterase [Halolamina rubra]
MADGPVDHSGSAPGNVMARLDRPRSDERTRIAVVADPHVSTREEGTSKLFEHTETHLENAVADINDREVDYTLCVGDITKDGERWNYDAADEILNDLETPFRAVPGNHDVQKEGYDHENLPLAEFEDRYTPDGSRSTSASAASTWSGSTAPAATTGSPTPTTGSSPTRSSSGSTTPCPNSTTP